jgi:hypothetical protein
MCLFSWITLRKIRPVEMLAMTVCVTLLVTPYVQSYDQILLIIPVLVVMGLMRSEGFPYLITASLFLAISILAFSLTFAYAGIGLDVWSVTIPGVLSLILGIWYFKWFRNREVR